MSVYIKGMEMPKSCSDCRFCADKWCYVIPEDGWQIDFCRPDRRPDWCPLIPVPDHGRCIDADAALSEMWQGLYAIEEKAEKEMGLDLILRCGMQNGHAVCVDAISNAPTIIPVDGGAK